MNDRKNVETKRTEGSNLIGALSACALTVLALTSVGCTDNSAADALENAAPSASSSSTSAPQTTASVTVPEGRLLEVRFADALSSKDSTPGTRFQAELTEPVMVDGTIAIPQGARVFGSVVEVNKADRLGGKASLELQFDELEFGGRNVPIAASLYTEERGEKKKDAERIGGGALGGAIIGELLDKDDGAKNGAAAGAVIGTVIAASTKGEEVQIAVGAPAHLRLTRPVTL